MENRLPLSRTAHPYQISQEQTRQLPGTEDPDFVTVQEVLLNCYQEDVIKRVRDFILSRSRNQELSPDEIPAQGKACAVGIKACDAGSSIDACSEPAQCIGTADHISSSPDSRKEAAPGAGRFTGVSDCVIFDVDAALCQPICHTEVTFYLQAVLRFENFNVRKVYSATYVFDFSPSVGSMYLKGVQCLGETRPSVKEGVRVSESLIPRIRNWEDAECFAESLFSLSYPEALSGGTCDPLLLAVRLGLRVRKAEWSEEITAKGQLFIGGGSIYVIHPETGRRTLATVPPNTILINTRRIGSREEYLNTIFHECCHYFAHSMCILLRSMAGRGTKPNASRNNPERIRCDTETDLLELQAIQLSYFVQMPRKAVLNLVARIRPSGQEELRRLALECAREFHVSPEVARYRLITLGFPDARGVCNYVCGKELHPFSLKGTWMIHTTYCIEPDEIQMLFLSDPAFARLLKSDEVVYVDGHLARKVHPYLRYTEDRFEITEEGYRSLDEFCIAFSTRRVSQHALSGGSSFFSSSLHRRVQKTYTPTFPKTPEQENQTIIEEKNSWIAFLEQHRNSTLFEVVEAIRKQHNKSQEQVADLMNLSTKQYRAALNAPDRIDLDFLFAIFLIIRVPYWVFERVVRGYTSRQLRDRGRDILLVSLLCTPCDFSLTRVNEILIADGQPVLNLR